MDARFEKLKKEVETDLGRSVDQDEEHELKLLYYFGKGVKLKNQLESEPQHIGEILPAVMLDIERRMEGQQKSQRELLHIDRKEFKMKTGNEAKKLPEIKKEVTVKNAIEFLDRREKWLQKEIDRMTCFKLSILDIVARITEGEKICFGVRSNSVLCSSGCWICHDRIETDVVVACIEGTTQNGWADVCKKCLSDFDYKLGFTWERELKKAYADISGIPYDEDKRPF